MLADHSIADAEAAKFGWTIPAEQWQETPRRQGRPKVAKTAVVTDSSASESEGHNATDLVEKLVAEAKEATQLASAPAPVADLEQTVTPVSHPVTVSEAPAVDLTATVGPADDLEAATFEDEPPLKVSPFTFEGVDYLIDKATNELYCTHTHEVVGTLRSAPEPWIEVLDAPTDGEEDEEDN